MPLSRPRFGDTEAAEILSKSGGCCRHCGARLDGGERRAWHIDHWPVRFADIEDQISCCGFFVTDARDPANLVASCVRCNTSHAYESSRWCGHSQCPCKRQWLRYLAAAAVGGAAGCAAALSAACSGP